MVDHNEEVLEELQALENSRRELPEIGNRLLQAVTSGDDNNMTPLDFIPLGVVKKCLSVSHGIDLMVREFNMTCARALVRVQLDAALRFGAFWLSEDPVEMAREVMGGKHINTMKDREGKRMTDSYLKKRFGEYLDWVPKVYDYMSGYIHFSEHPLYDPIVEIDETTRIVTWAVHEQDTKFPAASWVEVVKTANNCLFIAKEFLQLYPHLRQSSM